MSNEKNNGGPAFPYVLTEDWKEYYPGMSLRDYFAAKAMQGAMASGIAQRVPQEAMIAKLSYAIADAMLKAREK